MQKNIFNGFTLVELIIVITILAILSTIGFVSFQSYTINTRDANRLTTISNIQKGLSLYQAKNIKLPNPDDSTTIYASGVIIGYEGNVGDTVSNLIGISKTPLDPIRSENYIYYTNVNKDKSQVMGFMEGDEYKTISFLDNKITYAGKDDRNPRVEGEKLGIILDSSKQRVTGSGVDLLLTNSGITYTSYFDNSDILTSSGKDLFSNVYNRRSDLFFDASFTKLDSNLILYFDMESFSGNLLKDFSKTGKDGSFVGSYTLVPGKKGKSIDFNGVSNYLNLTGWNTFSPTKQITISIWINLDVLDTDNGGCLDNVVTLNPFALSGDDRINVHMACLGSIYWQFGTDGSNISSMVSTPLTKKLVGNWNNYIFTTNINSGYTKIYENGVLKSTSTATGSHSNTNADLTIGSIDGKIDEVRIYNRALSEQEIKSLYNLSY